MLYLPEDAKKLPLRGKTSPGRGKMSRSGKRGNLANECEPERVLLSPRRRFQRKQARQLSSTAQVSSVKMGQRSARRRSAVPNLKIIFPLKMRRATRSAFPIVRPALPRQRHIIAAGTSFCASRKPHCASTSLRADSAHSKSSSKHTTARCRGQCCTGRSCVKRRILFPPMSSTGGCQDKREYKKRMSKIHTATARRKMGVPLWNSRRYTAVHLDSWANCCRAAAGSL